MERYGRSSRDHNSRDCSNKLREPWKSYTNHMSYLAGGDHMNGFSWPPRSYTCSFCKREFRSAQALGGHMNVHRRDRARLRQSPTWDHSNPNPNPNPNMNLNPVPNLNMSPPSSSAETNHSPVAYTFPSLLSPLMTCLPSSSSTTTSPSSLMFSAGSFRPSGDELKSNKTVLKALFVAKGLTGFVGEGNTTVSTSAEGGDNMVRLDLEIGTSSRHLDEDLDLELRLGYTN